MNSSGQHVIADVWVKEFPLEKVLKEQCALALTSSGMTKLDESFHKFGEGAFTYVALLAESHFSIHTFPERNFLAIDCYTCGKEGDPVLAVQTLLSSLIINNVDMKIISRG